MRKLFKVSLLCSVLILGLVLTGCNQKAAQENNTPDPNADNAESSVVSTNKLPDEAIKAAESQLVKGSPTVLFFFAEWCPACRAFKPTVEEAEAKFPNIKVVRLNVDEQKELTKSFKITSIPSLFLFDRNGKFVESTTGGLPIEKLKQEFTRIDSIKSENEASEEVKTETKEETKSEDKTVEKTEAKKEETKVATDKTETTKKK